MSTHVVLAGGGLANGLIAWRLAEARPEVQVTLLEASDRIGGHHVWCFHDADVTAEQREWLAPLVVKSWPHHDVRFPKLERRLESGYHAVTSERFHDALAERLGDRAITAARIERLSPTRVHLSDGRRLDGDAVIDGRGYPRGGALSIGYQKFVGQWLQLEEPHGLTGPILMDATVAQIDGYRFIYTLPFGDHLLHVEDTRYSDGHELDHDALRADIRAYADRRGWRIRAVEREEAGVLPIVLAGDITAFWAERDEGVACSGMRAALFHPTTGYSLPEAVRLADAIAAEPVLTAERLSALTRSRSQRLWVEMRFFRMLNRLMFRAAAPERRYAILQQFYGRPAGLIERFYAGRLTAADRLQILSGRPPVPLMSAVRHLFSDGIGSR